MTLTAAISVYYSKLRGGGISEPLPPSCMADMDYSKLRGGEYQNQFYGWDFKQVIIANYAGGNIRTNNILTYTLMKL